MSEVEKWLDLIEKEAEPIPGLEKWTMDYRVKYGPFGWLLGQTMMKMMMGKILDGNLKGLANRVASIQTTAVHCN